MLPDEQGGGLLAPNDAGNFKELWFNNMAFNRPDADSLVAAFASSDFSSDSESWSSAVAADRPPDELQIPEPDEDGNYSTPALIAVYDALDEFDAGNMKESEILRLFDRIQKTVDDMLVVMDVCVQEGIDDPSNPINEAIAAAFEEHLDALDLLRGATTNKDMAKRGKALTALHAATNRLVDAYAFFQRLRNAASVVYCPNCSNENKFGQSQCSRCKTTLPVGDNLTLQGRLLAEASDGVLHSESAFFIKTPNYERIETAYTQWKANAISKSELRSELEAVEQNMATHREFNRSERQDLDDLDAEELQMMTKFLNAVDDAIEANLAAINRMKLYYENSDQLNLQQGFDMLALATTKMVEAYLAQEAMMQHAESEENEGEGDED